MKSVFLTALPLAALTSGTPDSDSHTILEGNDNTIHSIAHENDNNEATTGNLLSLTFCPIDYKLVQGVATDDVDHGSYTSNHTGNTGTGVIEHHCVPCPGDQVSNGGYSSTCHSAADWRPCSHMGCELVEVATRCKKYEGNAFDMIPTNNYVDPTQPLSGPKVSDADMKVCASASGGEHHRIRVFHHGKEESGTQHSCKMSGSREFTPNHRQCNCLCKDHGVQFDTEAPHDLTGNSAPAVMRKQGLSWTSHDCGDAEALGLNDTWTYNWGLMPQGLKPSSTPWCV
jgi:hypothetical protein